MGHRKLFLKELKDVRKTLRKWWEGRLEILWGALSSDGQHLGTYWKCRPAPTGSCIWTRCPGSSLSSAVGKHWFRVILRKSAGQVLLIPKFHLLSERSALFFSTEWRFRPTVAQGSVFPARLSAPWRLNSFMAYASYARFTRTRNQPSSNHPHSSGVYWQECFSHFEYPRELKKKKQKPNPTPADEKMDGEGAHFYNLVFMINLNWPLTGCEKCNEASNSYEEIAVACSLGQDSPPLPNHVLNAGTCCPSAQTPVSRSCIPLQFFKSVIKAWLPLMKLLLFFVWGGNAPEITKSYW